MNLLATIAYLLFSTTLWNSVGASVEDCEAPVTETKLDFFNSNLTVNTLHQIGGELRYSNVGLFNDNPIDMVVTVESGDYHMIEQYWAARNKGNKNGKNGYFGNINLQYKRGVPDSGTGNFRFCIEDSSTGAPVTLTNFTWTVWDLDERGDDNGSNGIGVKEKMMFDASQASVFSLLPNFDGSEVHVNCENPDGSPGAEIFPTDDTIANGGEEVSPGSAACPAGTRTLFRSCCNGVGADNPSDPEALTDLARSRAVSFFFENTSCWTFSYAMYCPLEVGGGTGTCRGGQYSGGNFLFAGESNSLFYEQGCPTAAPSQAPTPAPTDPPGYISVAFIKIKDLQDQGLSRRKR